MAKNSKGKRMVSEDEINYLQDLIANHEDPTADWGGDEYTAGEGIAIDNSVISANVKEGSGIVVEVDSTDDSLVVKIDTDTVPVKTDLATVATTGDYDDLLNKPTIPTVDYPVTDVTVNGTSVVTNKVAAVTVPTTATSTSTVTPTTETLTFTYSDNTTGTITFLTAATVSTTTTLS